MINKTNKPFFLYHPLPFFASGYWSLLGFVRHKLLLPFSVSLIPSKHYYCIVSLRSLRCLIISHLFVCWVFWVIYFIVVPCDGWWVNHLSCWSCFKFQSRRWGSMKTKKLERKVGQRIMQMKNIIKVMASPWEGTWVMSPLSMQLKMIMRRMKLDPNYNWVLSALWKSTLRKIRFVSMSCSYQLSTIWPPNSFNCLIPSN